MPHGWSGCATNMASQMNNSELNRNVSLLVGTGYACNIDILQTLIFAISAVVNILHFPVIYSMKKLNDNVSTKLLLVMSINDIGLAALRLAGIMCLYDWLETTHPCEYKFLHSLWEITALLRYITLAKACYNRYVATQVILYCQLPCFLTESCFKVI